MILSISLIATPGLLSNHHCLLVHYSILFISNSCNHLFVCIHRGNSVEMSSSPARKRPRPDDDEDGFIASEGFAGSRPGHVFRNGAQGMGYYRDDNDPTTTTTTTEEAAPRRKGVRIAEERNETRTIENVLAAAEQEAPAQRVLDLRSLATLRVALTAWHKAVETNALQRAQYATDPTQYMESEVALYEHVQAWKAVAAAPAAHYPVLVANDGSSVDLAADIVGPLLQHANTDVARATISLLVEWLDPALLVDDETDEIVLPVLQLASLALQEGLLDLVWANLGRFTAEQDTASSITTENENDPVGRGVWDVWQLLENLLDMETTLATTAAPLRTLHSNGTTSLATYIAQDTTLLGWLFAAVQDEDNRYRARALEILVLVAPLEDVYVACPDWTQIPPYTSSLLDEEDEGATKGKEQATPYDAVEILLQTVGAFRKRQPTNTANVELLENAAMVMTSALTYSTANRAAFLQAQGIELVVRCVKERVHAGGVALAWLDVPGTEDPVYQQFCEGMVQAQLLKYLGVLWMGRGLPAQANTNAPAATADGQAPAMSAAQKKAAKAWKSQITQTTIRVVYSLTRHLTASSPEEAQARLVAKFAADGAKLERLVHLLVMYDEKARTAEYKFYRDVDDEDMDDQAVRLAALEVKLAAGGDLFHRLGAIAAFLCTQSKQCHTAVLQQLQSKEAGMGLVRAAVQEFASVLEEGSAQRRQLEGYLEAL